MSKSSSNSASFLSQGSIHEHRKVKVVRNKWFALWSEVKKYEDQPDKWSLSCTTYSCQEKTCWRGIELHICMYDCISDPDPDKNKVALLWKLFPTVCAATKQAYLLGHGDSMLAGTPSHRISCKNISAEGMPRSSKSEHRPNVLHLLGKHAT